MKILMMLLVLAIQTEKPCMNYASPPGSYAIPAPGSCDTATACLTSASCGKTRK